MITKIKTILYLALILLISCESTQEDKDPEVVKTGKVGINLTPEKIRRAGIQVGQIEKVLLSHDVNARGMITIPPQHKATVSVVMPGIIKTIQVKAGEQVSKGEVLATYAHPNFIRLQKEYLDNLIQLQFLKKDYERQKKLRDQNINSAKELQAVELSYREAETAVESVKAQLDLLNINIENLENGTVISKVSILSPITGRINKVNTNIGMSVEPGINLFEILDARSLILQVKVFEKDMHLIKPGQRISFRTSGYEEKESKAQVVSIGAMVDNETRTIEVLAEIKDHSQGLIPGMFVSSIIHTSEQMLDALPESAIVIENDNETYGFYTLDELNGQTVSFHKFLLKTGFTEEGYIQVTPLEPVPMDAKIVLNGVYYIKSERMKSLE